MTELWFFAGEEHARLAGFRGPHGEHMQDRDMRAWWHGRDANSVHGLPLVRVVVTEGAREVTRRLSTQQLEEFDRARSIARRNLRHGSAVWIDL
jgi:hypothetical protein